MSSKTKDEYLIDAIDEINKIKDSELELNWDIKKKRDYIYKQIRIYNSQFDINIVEEEKELYVDVLYKELTRNKLKNVIEEQILLPIKYVVEIFYKVINKEISTSSGIGKLRNAYTVRNKWILVLENSIENEYCKHLQWPESLKQEKLQDDKEQITKLYNDLKVIDDIINSVSNELKNPDKIQTQETNAKFKKYNFRGSNDSNIIEVDGKSFSFKNKQAEIVTVLFRNLRDNKNKSMTKKEICESAEIEIKSIYIYFRKTKNESFYNNYIKTTPKRNEYSLVL